MNKFLSILFFALVISAGCDRYDHTPIWDMLNDHEERIAGLEDLCEQLNENIQSLQTIVAALQSNDYITSVVACMEGNKKVGYTLYFSQSGAVTIYHGKDGRDGQTWEQLGRATGEDGDDGDDFFQSVDTSNPDFVVITLKNGTSFSLLTTTGVSQGGQDDIYASSYGVVPGVVDMEKMNALLIAAAGKTIRFNSGEYTFPAHITVPSDISFIGNTKTVFKLAKNSGSNVLFYMVGVKNVTISHMFIDGGCYSCTYNHNSVSGLGGGIAIYANKSTVGWNFIGQNIWFGAVTLKDCKGIIFDGNIWGEVQFSSTSSEGLKNQNIVTNTYFYTDPQNIFDGNDGSTYFDSYLPGGVPEPQQ